MRYVARIGGFYADEDISLSKGVEVRSLREGAKRARSLLDNRLGCV
jgi:hypothetical protein